MKHLESLGVRCIFQTSSTGFDSNCLSITGKKKSDVRKLREGGKKLKKNTTQCKKNIEIKEMVKGPGVIAMALRSL